MKQIGLLKAIMETRRYEKLDIFKKRNLREARLRELVEYARKNSPYYSKLYEKLGPGWEFSRLPPVNKAELMANFDDWVTDRSIHLDEIRSFMENKDNIGRKFMGKYLVFTTSGSTGEPAVVLYDKTTMSVASAIAATRSVARSEDLKAFLKKGKKTVGLFADNGFYLGCGTVRYNHFRMPWTKNRQIIIDVAKPLEEVVEKLNEFQPAMLGGYPTQLELLIDEQRSGRLHISPVLIMTGGEYLSTKLRNELSETFGCYTQTNYSSTETGTMACECRLGRFHLNDDWILVEPVDENNEPVEPGQQSAKILITNLSNFTQPFIRYEVTDRVVFHKEMCSCGTNTRFLELEGRTDDILELDAGKGKTVRTAPLALYALIKEIEGVRRFQLILHEKNALELRLICAEGFDRVAVSHAISEAVEAFLSERGAKKPVVTLSEKLPETDPGSGKFKHIKTEKRCSTE